MNRGVKLSLVALTVLALLTLIGCAKIAEKATEAAIEKSTGVKVDQDKDSVTIQTEDGEATVASDAKLPDDFPSDVPIYENATVTSAMSNKTEGGTSYLVGFTSDDDPTQIFDWFKQAFKDKGWEITSTMDIGDSVGGLSAEKGELLATLSIGHESDKKAEMTITVTPKQ